ncbi:hypothetical protein HYX70_03155 [Candidatus Saccharibacteria bacterium]|nr:hypothetical protein [Candidatus Saccharibacteria bacterium]
MKAITRLKVELGGNKVFKDGWLLAILVLNAVFLVFLVGWSLTHIRSTEIQVPIRFSSLTNFDLLGDWYQLYEITAIGVLIFAINTFFAFLIHKRNRLMSIFLSLVSLMALVLACAILIGFTAVNYGSS